MKLTVVFTLFLVLMGAMMTSAKICACLTYYDPVCGKNGVTYGNDCEAYCARQEVAYKGVCSSKQQNSLAKDY